MIKILMVDDHLIVRQGIKRILDDVPDMKITNEVSSGKEALDLIKKKKTISQNSIKIRMIIFPSYWNMNRSHTQ